MKFIIDKPHRMLIPDGIDLDRIRKFLTFRDKSIQFEMMRLKRQPWLRQKWGEEYFDRRLAELKEQSNRCLIFEEDGLSYTYSGLAQEMSAFFGVPVENTVDYPDPVSIPWSKVPKHTMRPYQEAALKNLLEVKHGAVSIGTGLGKSLIILNLVKALGQMTIIVTPSVSIASQMFELFKETFGTRYVGMYGDGKKQFKKKFVVALAQSLTRLEPGTDAYDALSKCQVLIADESHLLPATTFEKVFVGIGKSAPYRFCFSATQMRTDGAELLLRGLIGPIVYKMNVEDGVTQGYLARPLFRMMQVVSNSKFESDDANKMDRVHLLTNPIVIEAAAQIANHAASTGKPVLILIDEFVQAALLDRYLVHPREFAHGGMRSLTPKERARQRRDPESVQDIKEIVPEKFWESDPVDQVRRYNAGAFPILIGTSAIGLGTDVLPAQVLIIIRKGTSEIKFAQSVGRGTRRSPGKETCLVVDFDVTNIPIVSRHARARVAIYESILGPVQYIDLTRKNV